MKKSYYLTTLKETSINDMYCWGNVAQNTGNLVFYKAIQKGLNIDTLTFDQMLSGEYEVDNLISADLIWLREETEYDFIIDFYHKVKDKVKFIPLSIGLHTGKRTGEFQLSKNVVKFLAEMSEQVTLACRGEFTADTLNNYGIKNITILGCPSLYYHRNDMFSIHKPLKLPANPKLSTNCTLYPNQYSPPNILRDFIEFTQLNQAVYIEQTNFEWIDKLANNEKEKLAYEAWVKKTKYFFNFEEWFNYIKQFDFVMGNRFHGNVISILAGIPSLVFVHDNRIQEMCEHFKIPFLQMQDFNKKRSVEYWYDKADYTEFNKNYPKRYQEFRAYLEQYGIPV